MAKTAHKKLQRPLQMGNLYMAATNHHMAAQTDFTIPEAGDNAIDAGVAACVLESERVGLVSVAPIMIDAAPWSPLCPG
jgi:gamma-glutamyltranspeptidase/glutathione hydrolase